MQGKLTRRGKGQALVLFLGFAAAMIGILLVSFNSGQVTNAKMRAMNAADAAAYSGAVWQARTLNFQAYMNRAMVVNEVTIAQSVSLRSWIDYLARFVSNIETLGKYIPWVGPFITAVSKGLDAVETGVDRLMPNFERAARAASHAEHEVQNIFNGYGDIGALDIAIDVAKKNGAAISTGGYALIKRNHDEWGNFTDEYTRTHRPAGTSGDGRKRFRAVTLDSRDGFSENRKWNQSLFGILGEFDKQGGTDLVNYDAWKGLDSAAYCTVGRFGKCPWIPLGWGGAQASFPKANGIGQHGSGDWNRTDGRLARTEANRNSQVTTLPRRFPDYRDLKVLDTSKTAQQKVSFAVEVVVADKEIPTARTAMSAQAALVNGAKIEHDPQYAADAGVFGLSEGCVAFERPVGEERADGGVERPSLFNPYWRASLATPSKDTRKIVGGAKLLPPIEAFFGGIGSCE
ncbi:pilus assembly protein TadG-related protein [Massilia haematophila]|uniref:Pilus assembly protein TadG-related protein n=1 Tax=Massilia haematophila TaxID=457923 RepID=A0ABV7PE99_9BURK